MVDVCQAYPVSILEIVFLKMAESYKTRPILGDLTGSEWKGIDAIEDATSFSVNASKRTTKSLGTGVRNDFTQFDYYNIEGGSTSIRHHAGTADHYQEFLKAGYGKLYPGDDTDDMTAGATTAAGSITVELGAGDGLSIVENRYYEFTPAAAGVDPFIALVKSVSTDTVTLNRPTPVALTGGDTVKRKDTWDPQCLSTSDYFTMLVKTASGTYLMWGVKPSIVPSEQTEEKIRGWKINFTAHKLEKITDSAELVDANTILNAATEDAQQAVYSTTNVLLVVNSNERTDALTAVEEVVRKNELRKGNVNEGGSSGSINFPESYNAKIDVVENDFYENLSKTNTVAEYSIIGVNGLYMVYAPLVKTVIDQLFANKQDELTSSYMLNMSSFQSGELAVYLGDISA